MKIKKQIIALVCALTMVLTTVLTGCGSSGDGSSKESGSQAVSSSAQQSEAASSSAQEQEQATAEAGKPSRIGNGEKLVIGMVDNSLITDYEDNYLTKKLEEDLNVDLEIVPLPSGEFATKVSMMLASGEELPDIIMGKLSHETVYEYGAQGYFLPLNEYLEDPQLSPTGQAMPEDVREKMLQVMTSPVDGNIYALAGYSPMTWNMSAFRMFINREWLEVLNLEMPTTTDELYEVLKAFANEDPNGNGLKDEIPVYGIAGNGRTYGMNTVWALMNSFVFYNGRQQNGGLALDDTGKTVIAPFTTEEWRQGLEYLRKLCSEGLLPASVFTDDATQYKAMLNAETPVVGLVCSGALENYTDYENNKNLQQMELVPPFTGPEGVAYTPTIGLEPEMRSYITTDCENPELAYALCEYFYDRTMTLIGRYGEEGVDWTTDPEALAGYPSAEADSGITDTLVMINYKTDVNIWGSPSNKFWRAVQNFAYSWGDHGEIDATIEKEEIRNSVNYKVRLSFYENYADKHPEYLLPGKLVYAAENMDEAANLKTDICSLVDSSTAEFITGQRELSDAGWQEYLDSLDALGLERYLEISQAAYDRMTQ